MGVLLALLTASILGLGIASANDHYAGADTVSARATAWTAYDGELNGIDGDADDAIVTGDHALCTADADCKAARTAYAAADRAWRESVAQRW